MAPITGSWSLFVKTLWCMFGVIAVVWVVHIYMHNSETKGCIRIFYLSNNCSTNDYCRYLFFRLELHARYNRQDTDPKMLCNHFPIGHFVHTYAPNSKTSGHIWMLYMHIKQLLYYRKCLFFVLELDVRYERQVMDSNTPHSVFMIIHLCILTCKPEKYRSHTYMNVEHMKQLLYYQRHSLCGLQLHERSDWWTKAPDRHWSFYDTTLCAYTASPYIHHYLVRNYALQQNSCTL